MMVGWSRRLRTMWVLVLLLLSACDTTEVECADDDSCGFGETCVAGVCTAKGCANSSQCAMEEHCAGGTCVEGCVEDADCYADSVCNFESGVCEDAACRSTTLDCGFNEFCDTITGDCYDASGYYCRQCPGGTDEECGGNGNLCFGWGGYGNWCGVTCEEESDCPSGFTCVEVSDGTGNLISKQCITYCWLYIDDDSGPPSQDDAAPRGEYRGVPIVLGDNESCALEVL